MNMREASKCRGREQPFLSRKRWVEGYLVQTACRTVVCPIKLMLTDSPDGILLYSVNDGGVHKAWHPTLDDITAEDWFPTA